MADDVQTPQPAPGVQEPSMEEILASIRKIIADETDPAAARNGQGADVLELTQMVQDDGTVANVKAEPPPAPPPIPEPVRAAAPPPPLPPPPPVMAPPLASVEPLVSDPAASAAQSALSSLANTVEIERLATTPPMTATFLGNSARTLEDMTMQLMKPLLKEWLDQNLPAMVDKLVQKEISRITKKVQE